ncbi:MAG: Hydrolase, TatD family [Microgenomates group bacterium GW2011_GWC1_37_8]|uniref:Hydrolase, TatD family n=1 Tax=Candidatus Woesebacteria bacterium GW2011_GWB1_38_8 TaxID=1618570 RepID=A0A0G0LBP2_9BACT|nr:MAG: Hydrolase, TatD family [Microgenomates group bacterium GW2011_GWC1_37_8]KKQ85275.1 MAG: Hydrolase, TatD family [Candidatus Woesebacteria bacterium GW2011_GWB1_38_8]
MFDSHCHLNFQAFSDTYEAVIKSANNEGIDYILIPGTDLENSEKAIELAEGHKGIFAAVGMHPTKDFEKTDLNSLVVKLEELCTSHKVVAIGEIGLDYYRYKSGSEVQKKYFLSQLELGLRLEKAIIIHNRHAGEDILKLLYKNWVPGMAGRCVFHCCESDFDLLEFAKDKNIFIGVDGDVTYDTQKQLFIKRVPLSLLLVETDSPYILPEPLRSQKERKANEPKNLIYILKKVSEIKNIQTNELIKITKDNAVKLFAV